MMTFLRSQSQTVLAILLGVIALGFLFYGNAGSLLTNSSGRVSSDYGRIDGEDLSSAEMNAALTNTRMLMKLQGEEEVSRNQVNEEAWRQLLLLHEADQLHIVFTDKEVADNIKGMPFFQKDGAFSYDQYKVVMANMENGPLHLSPDRFAEIIRDKLRSEAAFNALFSTVRVSPQDVSKTFEKYYGPATVSIVTFDPKAFMDVSQVKPEEIEAEYKNDSINPAYRTPEKRKVDYILLSLTPEQAKLPDAEKSAAKDALGQKALDFALALQPDPSANGGAAPAALDFVAEAKKQGLTPATTDFFTAETPPANVPPSAAFNSAAFALSKEDPVSKVIELANGVAVLHLVDVQASQLRPLDEVKTGIAMQLQQQKASQAAQVAAQNASLALKSAINNGTDFKAAAANLKLQVETIPAFVPFTTMQAQGDMKLATIAYSILPLEQNQVSEPIPMQTDNTTIVVHVDARAKGNQASMSDFEKHYREGADQKLRSLAYMDWADWTNKRPGNHKPADLDSFGNSD